MEASNLAKPNLRAIYEFSSFEVPPKSGMDVYCGV